MYKRTRKIGLVLNVLIFSVGLNVLICFISSQSFEKHRVFLYFTRDTALEIGAKIWLIHFTDRLKIIS